MENIVGMMCEVVNKSLEGIASPDEVSKQFDDINKLLKSYDNEKFQQLVKDNEELVAQVKTLGESIEKMKQKGLSMNAINKFDEKLNEMLDSEKFRDFAEGAGQHFWRRQVYSRKQVLPGTWI